MSDCVQAQVLAPPQAAVPATVAAAVTRPPVVALAAAAQVAAVTAAAVTRAVVTPVKAANPTARLLPVNVPSGLFHRQQVDMQAEMVCYRATISGIMAKTWVSAMVLVMVLRRDTGTSWSLLRSEHLLMLDSIVPHHQTAGDPMGGLMAGLRQLLLIETADGAAGVIEAIACRTDMGASDPGHPHRHLQEQRNVKAGAVAARAGGVEMSGCSDRHQGHAMQNSA